MLVSRHPLENSPHHLTESTQEPIVTRMTEPQKRNRHLNDKTPYPINNWRECEPPLRDRGGIALWISQDAIDACPSRYSSLIGLPVCADSSIAVVMASV